jgi:hypothetical protein
MKIKVINVQDKPVTTIEAEVVPRRDEFICIPDTDEGEKGVRYHMVRNVYHHSVFGSVDIVVQVAGSFFVPTNGGMRP